MQKNTHRAWLALIAAVSFLCLTVQGQNLVNNPGFETGYSDGWNHLAGDGGAATYSGITVGAYDGTSLQAEVTAPGASSWSIQTLGPQVALTSGQTYILSFYARADADGRQLNMVVQDPGYAQNTFDLTTEWERYTWTFVAPGDSPHLNIQYLNEGTYQIDNIMIVPQTPPSTTNLISNGDFERGIVDGWDNLAQDDGVAVYTETYANAYDGTSFQVQVLVPGGNPWSIQSLGPTPALTNGADYRLSFYGRSAVSGVPINMVLQTSGYMAQSFTLTDEWVLYTWNFTAAEDNPQLRMQFPNAGTFYIDDVTIVPQSTSSTPPAGNLVNNGNFELGAGTGWTRLAQDGADAVYSEIYDYDGISFQVQVNQLGTNSWSIQALGPTLALEPGEEYILTFDARTDTVGGSMAMVIQDNQYLDRSFVLTDEWTEYSWTFTAAESSPSIRMQFLSLGTYAVDNIVILPVVTTVGNTNLTLSPNTRHQRMLGFGAAISWYSSWPFFGERYDELMDVMFNDLGMDILRLKNWYYPPDYPTNKEPVGMPEQADFIAAQVYFQAAKQANPNMKVLLSSWTPPTYLKSNNNLVGGTLRSDADGFMYEEFAQYWNDVLDNLGWNPDFLSFQNEPGYLATWESSEWRPTETSTLPGYAEASEAIWNAIMNRPNVPIMIGAETENIGQAGWNSSLNLFREFTTPLRDQPWIGAYAYHIYNIYNDAQIDGIIPQLNMIRDEFGDRPNFMTEYSSEQFDWHRSAVIIHNNVVEANTAAYIYWKLIWASSPDTMISVDTSGNFEIRPHYYTIKHYSKHISEGYRRIELSGSDAFIKASAFLRPDGRSITMVVINDNPTERDVTLNSGGIIGGSVAAYQSVADDYYRSLGSVNLNSALRLPGKSITTLVIPVASSTVAPGDPGPIVGPVFESHNVSLVSNTLSRQSFELPGSHLLSGSINYAIIGNIPSGLSMVDGRLEGFTPNLGTYTFTVRMTSGADQIDVNFVLNVIPPTLQPLITGLNVNGLAHFTNVLQPPQHGSPAKTELFTYRIPVGEVFSMVPSWDFIKPPFDFILVRGELPNGLYLNRQTGEISGIPTTPGSYTFVLSVRDWRGRGFQWINLIVE